jgi:hypothetical protein
MTKQVRISDRAAEYLTEQMKRNRRRFIADELDTILFLANGEAPTQRVIANDKWNVGARPRKASRGIIESEKPRMADSTDANPATEVIEP